MPQGHGAGAWAVRKDQFPVNKSMSLEQSSGRFSTHQGRRLVPQSRSSAPEDEEELEQARAEAQGSTDQDEFQLVFLETGA